MKILVTGGAGFIGSHIVDLLIDKGHYVIVVDNLVTGKKENVNSKAKFYEVDICSSFLEEVFIEEKPDYVIHVAAQVNVRKSINDPLYDANVNILGSIRLLELCRKYNIKRIVYTSSGGARYGEPLNIPCSEKHSIKPLCPYGVSKHAVEHYLYFYNKVYGLDYNIVAYANVYGPRQDPMGEAGVVSIFIGRLLKNSECLIFGDGEQTRDFVYVSDVASAAVLALEKETESKDFNIGTGVETSVNKIFFILKDLNKKGKCKYVDAVAGEIRNISLDISQAKDELGYEPKVEIREGLKRTFDFFKSL
jgi:UDP-glucose 4-epimerase